jgi:hypothetical protein
MTDRILIVIAYPVVGIYWIIRYANLQPTWPRKIGMFVTFIPVWAFGSLLWFGTIGLLYGFARILLFTAPS